MEDRSEERDEQLRKTEQGDDLPDDYSLAEKLGRPSRPYVPPRQPVQEPPDGDDQRGGGD